MLTATMMVLGLAACGATDTKDGAGDTSAAGSGSRGDLIKVESLTMIQTSPDIVPQTIKT